jgi:integrase
MTPRKRKSRIYWRTRGADRRAYADFRDYGSVGGGLEALIPDGERRATSDPDIAQALVAARLKELDALRRGLALHGRARGATLASYAAEHLIKKAKAGKVTHDWMMMAELFLARAVEFLGSDRELESIGVEDVQGWANHLAATPNKHGRRLGSGTVRHALNALSNLYRRAQSEAKVPVGFNPVAAMLEKPSGTRREARWLEVPDAALLLESARTLPPAPPQLVDALPADFAYALVATFLLTGGRSAEVLGLETADISFDKRTVTFRPHAHRRLKTLRSARVVPLWPQLAEILQAHIIARPPKRLLFPSFATGREAMLTDWRGTLDRIALRAGFWEYVLGPDGEPVKDKKGQPRQRGVIRSRMFRHTYCAARLQTLDGGAPVSPFTVSRELGHGSGTMVEEVYAHLGTIRHRSEVVEYRIEQQAAALGERLKALGLLAKQVV